MKYWLIDFFLILFIFISIGCAKVEISYSGTAEDLIDTCLANNELDFPNNSVLEIEGQIKKVFFPKDTIKNNECIIKNMKTGIQSKIKLDIDSIKEKIKNA